MPLLLVSELKAMLENVPDGYQVVLAKQDIDASSEADADFVVATDVSFAAGRYRPSILPHKSGSVGQGVVNCVVLYPRRSK
jgi:hypothetical protein